MTKDEFILWLHGFFEISNAKTLNEDQTALIKGEVEKFFTKVTPDRTVLGNRSKAFDEYWEIVKRNEQNKEWGIKPLQDAPTPVIPPAQTPDWPKYDPSPPWTPSWETPRVTCGGVIYGEDFKIDYTTC